MIIASRGFSLIEAMISVLVLSVGLLGLAQLQARLSLASARLQASTQAHVLGAAGIERSLALRGSNPDPAAGAVALVSTPATRYRTSSRLAGSESLLSAETRVQWTQRADPQEIRLKTLALGEPRVSDARLLLPTD